jgi:hypothetical protein
MSPTLDDRPVLPFEGQPSVDEWHVLLAIHPNLLLIGPDHATDAALLTLTPQLRQPICCCRGGEPLTLPTEAQRTLILREVDALEANQQHLLLRWLDRCRTQVISVTSESLFSQVECGAFLEPLYYRLNALHLEVGPARRTISSILTKLPSRDASGGPGSGHER